VNIVLDWITIVAVTAGVFFFLAGTAGLLRFPDAVTRLHALTKADNLGLGLVALGLIAQAHSAAVVFELLVIWVLVVLSGSTAAQLIARAQRRGDAQP